ncbi:MAG: hypothetical protein JXA93_03450 [Anaerolineae bacterium]|nr:hypothetical protein [Anaerolineae bacterium]
MTRKAVLAFAAVIMLTIVPLSPVHAQAHGEFLLQRWATQQGNLIGGMLWFDGDFNGDGPHDLATVWNDAAPRGRVDRSQPERPLRPPGRVR